jgi:hypothetical protein
VPRHVAQLVTWLITLLVVDYSTSCRLVVDYFSSAACPSALARCMARHAARHATRRRLLHVARLVTRLVADNSASRRLVVDNSASRRLVVDYSTSRRLVADYFDNAAHLGASARRAARHAARRASCRRLLHVARLVIDYFDNAHVRVPRHIARLVTQLVVSLVVDYSASRRLIVHYFASAARPGASARRVARHASRRATRRRQLCLVQARRRLLRLRCASG